MSRSLVAGLMAGILALSCVCVSLSCGVLYFFSGYNQGYQEASTSRFPFIAPKPPANPVVAAPVAGNDAEDVLVTAAIAQSVGDTFLTALRDNLNDEAFNLFHPELQTKFVSGASLAKQVDSNNVRPATWGKWKVDSLATDARNRTKISTTVTFKDGSTGTADFEIGRLDGESTIFAFNLKH